MSAISSHNVAKFNSKYLHYSNLVNYQVQPSTETYMSTAERLPRFRYYWTGWLSKGFLFKLLHTAMTHVAMWSKLNSIIYIEITFKITYLPCDQSFYTSIFRYRYLCIRKTGTTQYSGQLLRGRMYLLSLSYSYTRITPTTQQICIHFTLWLQ